MTLFDKLKLVPESVAQNYKVVGIPKKEGTRIIFIPNDQLKKIQQIILKQIFRKTYKSWYSKIHGLYTGSNVMHACEHKDSRYVFQFDIKDAFPSVNVESLRKILFEKFARELEWFRPYVDNYNYYFADSEAMKNSEDILWEEYKECTNEELRLAWKDVKYSSYYHIIGRPENLDVEKTARELADLVIRLTTYRGILPQGTSTAPFLFYIYLSYFLFGRELNSEWSWMILREKCKLSCYVDGFVISSDEPISPEFRKKILEGIEDMGLEINKSKTRYQDCRNGAVMITGIVVDGTGKVRLSKKTIKKWRGTIHRAMVTRDPELIKRVEGFMAYIQSVYGKNIPAQIAKPYLKLQEQNPP